MQAVHGEAAGRGDPCLRVAVLVDCRVAARLAMTIRGAPVHGQYAVCAAANRPLAMTICRAPVHGPYAVCGAAKRPLPQTPRLGKRVRRAARRSASVVVVTPAVFVVLSAFAFTAPIAVAFALHLALVLFVAFAHPPFLHEVDRVATSVVARAVPGPVFLVAGRDVQVERWLPVSYTHLTLPTNREV